jgi:long-chain acyl-CoA synthetase
MTSTPAADPLLIPIPGFWNFALQDPDRVAIVDHDGSRISFGALRDRVNQLSHALRELAPGDNAQIAAVTSNRADFMTWVMACAQIGVRYTPISSHLTEAEIAYIVQDSGSDAVFVDAVTAKAAAPAARASGLDEDHVISLDPGLGLPTLDELIAGQPTELPPDRLTGTSMLYTSGTSGRPKGVKPDRREAVPELAAMRIAGNLTRWGIDPLAEVGQGICLVTSPLYHAAPIAYTTLALHLGHTCVIMSRFDAMKSLELVEAERVTWMHVVPTMMKRWLDLDESVTREMDLRSLRWILHGAAPCPVDVKRRIIEWMGPIVYEYYAATEAGGTIILPDDWMEHPGSVGRPWGEAAIRILSDDGDDLPAGEAGMIYMRNLRPFIYHNDPEKTQAAQADGGEFVTVGDYGYVDDEGYLWLLDRRTDLVISGGVNVYPAEIEAKLLEHPAVADAGAVGIPHEDLGQTVLAVVEPRDRDIDADELIESLHAFCKDNLGSAKRPRAIVVGDVPRSATGKVLRRTLREQHTP